MSDAPPLPLLSVVPSWAGDVDAHLQTFDHLELPVDLLTRGAMAGVSHVARSAFISLVFAAYQHAPAGCLVDDDASLAAIAGFGGNVSRWLRVRAQALTGWARDTEGRLWCLPILREIEAGLTRRADYKSNSADRQARRRVRMQLEKCGVPAEIAAAPGVDVKVLQHIADHGRKITVKAVSSAASELGLFPDAENLVRPLILNGGDGPSARSAAKRPEPGHKPRIVGRGPPNEGKNCHAMSRDSRDSRDSHGATGRDWGAAIGDEIPSKF